jgi:serine/threonine protein kinase
MTENMHLAPGTLLQGGKYRIVRYISSGGFGCTYEALHVMLEKRVAIKEFFVKDFCNRDEQTAHVTVGTQSKKGLVDKLKKKFIDEAKGLCQLQHAHIVRASDVFEENGTAYFVMDFINGHSLSELVKKSGPMPEQKALNYIRQVADALRYVHEHNRLHLDVKPANIMIDADDQAILIDFGASKQYDEESGENTSTLLGKTPGYAPLEQMGNDVVKFTPATDVYALGATLYKLLTGKTPLSASLLASGEDLEPLPATVSASTANAVAEAMRVNKKKRPQSMTEFLHLLESGTEKKTTTEEDMTDVMGDEEATELSEEETELVQEQLRKLQEEELRKTVELRKAEELRKEKEAKQAEEAKRLEEKQRKKEEEKRWEKEQFIKSLKRYAVIFAVVLLIGPCTMMVKRCYNHATQNESEDEILPEEEVLPEEESLDAYDDSIAWDSVAVDY